MYQSPFSPNEIKYFMGLMQNDTTIFDCLENCIEIMEAN